MRAIFFIEIEGVKYYKADSFWSKSKNFTHAKIHTDCKDDKDRFFKSLVSGLKPYPSGTEWDDEDWVKIQRWQGSLYGYQTVVSEGKSDRWTLSEDSVLSKPYYLKRIDTVDRKGEVEFSDAVVVLRDQKINEIINLN
jgi:hypothetical protein